MLTRSYQILISKIAILAVMFAALAPTLSYAFPAKNNAQTLWQEICSAQGNKRIALTESTQSVQFNVALSKSDTPSAPPGKMAMHLEHCPYCFSNAGTIGLPSAPLALFLKALNDPSLINIYDSLVLPLYHQTTHPSHAPPSI